MKQCRWIGALQCLDKLKAAGAAPNAITYSALISACEKGGQTQMAVQYFNEMKAAGVAPNVITYSALISACEKGGQTQMAVQYFNEMKAAGVAPNVITYNALISACEKGGQTQMAASILSSAVYDRIYQKELGYSTFQNKLNLHVNSVYMSQASYQHEPGVSTDVAKALFYHHWNAGNIHAGTRIVVGRYGNGLLKQAIKDCLTAYGMDYMEDQFLDGEINEGCLIVASLHRNQGMGAASGLNPYAQEFQPSWM